MVVHELIHAFDHCRAANLDWSNCRHHACSEVRPSCRDPTPLCVACHLTRGVYPQVRAASLSGDCSFSQELLRGNIGITGQHKKCVRRRAELSVAMNPACQGPAAKAAVDACFEDCFRDTAPFERIP